MNVNDADIQIPKHKMFSKELRLQGRTIEWVADNMGFCYQHTYRILRGKVALTETNTRILNELLNTNY